MRYDPEPGKRLMKFREDAGLSMARLADMVKPRTTAGQINKLEKASVEFTPSWARRLGDALGIHYLEFFDAIPKPTPDVGELLEKVTGMSESDRATAFTVIDALAQRSREPGSVIPMKSPSAVGSGPPSPMGGNRPDTLQGAKKARRPARAS